MNRLPSLQVATFALVLFFTFHHVGFHVAMYFTLHVQSKGKKITAFFFFFAISENERDAFRKLAPLQGEENIIILGRVQWVVPFPKNTSTYSAKKLGRHADLFCTCNIHTYFICHVGQ